MHAGVLYLDEERKQGLEPCKTRGYFDLRAMQHGTRGPVQQHQMCGWLLQEVWLVYTVPKASVYGAEG